MMIKNIERNELEKFDALASGWWDPKGKSRPLHELNPTRLQFISDRAPLNQQTVLDIGCGGGILSESLSMRGAIVTGIDASRAVLEVAKLHALENNCQNLRYEEATAEEYALTHPQSFDIITCLELLEHVPDPQSVIQAASTLVKPGGHLFFSTLNRTPKSYFLAILGAEYVLNLLPRGTHDYSKFIKPSELHQCLRNADLTLIETEGLQYNPLTHRSKLTDDISVNYLAYAIKT